MLSRRPSRLRFAPRLALVAVVAYAFIWVSGFPRQFDDDELPPSAQHPHSPEPPYPVQHDQIIVSVKTTALEAYEKVPPLLVLTPSPYHDSLLLMSDLQMDIGHFHLHDVLDRVDGRLKESHPDLERYRRQLQFSVSKLDFSKLEEEDPQKEKDILGKMDKYKYLHMLQRTWDFRPERPWYVFVDADTYLIRPNLQAWLGHYDPERPIFFANLPDVEFPDPTAISGSTFVLSVGAMRALLVDRENVVASWDKRIPDFKSGFEVVYSALSTELGLEPNRTWPSISGFHPRTIPFNPGIWCEPVFAMHSVPPDVASSIWRLQQDREEIHHIRDPLAFADLWNYFILPENMDDVRDDWDNLSSQLDNSRWNILFDGRKNIQPRSRFEDGRAADGEESWEACRESCNNNMHCVQYSYSSVPTSNHNENGETKCHLSSTMRMGWHVDPGEREAGTGKTGVSWKSGWRKDKFQTWAQQQRCKGQQDTN